MLAKAAAPIHAAVAEAEVAATAGVRGQASINSVCPV